MKEKFENWTSLVFYLKDLDYGWDSKNDSYHKFGKFKYFGLAFSGVNGKGEVLLNNASFGKKGMNSFSSTRTHLFSVTRRFCLKNVMAYFCLQEAKAIRMPVHTITPSWPWLLS